MNWRLRRAAASDAAALAMVAGATFLETFAGVLTGADIVAHCAAKSSTAVFQTWVANAGSIVTLAQHEHGAAPIGYTVLTDPVDVGPVAPGDIELRRIYTLSAWHGRGLGTAMMARAIDDARAMRRTRITLGVLGTNVRARDFYEREGFIPVGERRFRVGDAWHDDVVYARVLPSIG